jgi:3-mercaptopyruvate sulfurtransferase SseA
MKGIIHMRFITLALLAFLVAIGGLVACNSNETILSQTPKNSSSPQQSPPSDNARRIKVAEAHEIWEKGDAVVIDTRAEAAYKEEHIKGSISMPTGTVLSRVDELPRNKMIIAYCT